MKKIYLFAVIFALITGFATYFFVDGLKHNSAITGEEEADVLIALQDINEDTVVTADMFDVRRLPVSSITYGAVADVNDIEGFVATNKIFKGEQVLAAKLTLIDKEVDGLEYNGEYRLSYHLENGAYAYTISVSDINNIGNFIREGDYINLYIKDPVQTDPILKNLKVLKIGTYSDNKLSEAGTETVTSSLITVILDNAQLKKVMTISEDTLRVALVPYVEGAKITTLPEKTTVNEYGEVVTVKRKKEPKTNYGMGEVQTTTTTAAAK